MRSYRTNSHSKHDLNTEVPEDYKIKVIQIEQDHRFIKKRTKLMFGFKSFYSAEMTITGIENVRMIQKRQIIGANDHLSTFENFAMLMAS